MTITLDDRRLSLVHEAACQTCAVLDTMIARDLFDGGPFTQAMIVHMRALSSAVLRAFDEMEPVDEIEEIVFGKVQAHEAEEEEATA